MIQIEKEWRSEAFGFMDIIKNKKTKKPVSGGTELESNKVNQDASTACQIQDKEESILFMSKVVLRVK